MGCYCCVIRTDLNPLKFQEHLKVAEENAGLLNGEDKGWNRGSSLREFVFLKKSNGWNVCGLTDRWTHGKMWFAWVTSAGSLNGPLEDSFQCPGLLSWLLSEKPRQSQMCGVFFLNLFFGSVFLLLCCWRGRQQNLSQGGGLISIRDIAIGQLGPRALKTLRLAGHTGF